MDDKIPDNYMDNIGYDLNGGFLGIIKSVANTASKTVYNATSGVVSNAVEAVKTSAEQITAAFRYHPNLSFMGMQHAILLGTEFYNKQPNIKVVFVSPMIRTIMTALVSLRTYAKHNEVNLYIVPYIHEKKNVAGKLDYDYQNSPLTKEQLERMIPVLKEWLRDSWFQYYDDIEVVTKLNMIKEYMVKNQKKDEEMENIIHSILNCKTESFHTHKQNDENYRNIFNKNKKKIYDSNYDNDFKMCVSTIFMNKIKEIYKLLETENYRKIEPEVKNFFKNILDDDFRACNSIKIHYDLINFETPENADYKKFYNEVLSRAYDENILDRSITDLYVISHGNMMRSYFSEYLNDEYKKHIMNTHTFCHTIELIFSSNIVTDFKNINFDDSEYVPKKLRSLKHNFEILNMDICRTQSLKGVLNHLYDHSDLKNYNTIPPDINNLIQKYKRLYSSIKKE